MTPVSPGDGIFRFVFQSFPSNVREKKTDPSKWSSAPRTWRFKTFGFNDRLEVSLVPLDGLAKPDSRRQQSRQYRCLYVYGNSGQIETWLDRAAENRFSCLALVRLAGTDAHGRYPEFCAWVEQQAELTTGDALWLRTLDAPDALVLWRGDGDLSSGLRWAADLRLKDQFPFKIERTLTMLLCESPQTFVRNYVGAESTPEVEVEALVQLVEMSKPGALGDLLKVIEEKYPSISSKFR